MVGGRWEYPDLWAFLESLSHGERVSGTIAAIESFGVFVALDSGPAHPVFPGVGFITMPELCWWHFEAATDIVRVGEHVVCEFLQFDTTNLEARLSLRAAQPDPFQAFAESTAPGCEFAGRVTKILPFGLFVQVADRIEGFMAFEDSTRPHEELAGTVRVGDELAVVVAGLDRERRLLRLSLR